TVQQSTVDYPPGQAGLPTTRLTCRLTAPSALTTEATVTVRDGYRGDRIGWHELTATPAGVALLDPPVPSASISDELRSYPNDLRTSPLDVREATLHVAPGSGVTGGSSALTVATPSRVDGMLGRATAAFTALAGSHDLTPLVGALAILLSLV